MRWVLLAALLAGCPKKVEFDLSIPDAPSAVEGRPPMEVLEEASRDAGPSVRARAIALGVELAPERTAWVGRALYDPDPGVARAGVLAARPHVDDPEVRALVVQLATRDADAYARAAAAVVLAPSGSDEARDALHAAWHGTREPAAKGALAFGAAVLGDEEAVDVAARALSRGDVGLELGFLADVGDSGITAFVDALREGEEWAEEELLLAYAAARIALGDGGGRGTLGDALHDDDPLVRMAVVDAAAQLDGGGGVLKRARKAGPESVRTYASLVVDARKGRITSRFGRAVTSDDPEIRLAAVVWARIGASGDPEAARDIARVAVIDDSPRVRAEAAHLLGVVGFGDGDRERVESLLLDEDVMVRVEAAGALLR